MAPVDDLGSRVDRVITVAALSLTCSAGGGVHHGHRAEVDDERVRYE